MKGEIIKSLVDAGLEMESAVNKVEKLYNTVKTLRPEDSDEKIWAIVRLKINEFIQEMKRGGIQQFEGVLLGFTAFRDVYAGIKQSILNEYERDPAGAIADGIVRVEEDGTVIPIDNRSEINGEPNPNYGKPIPTWERRDLYMVINDQFKRCYGPVKDDPEVGYIYKFFGTDRGNTISISRTRPIRKVSDVPSEELWNIAKKHLDQFLVPISEFTGNERDIVALKGTVIYHTETAGGNTLIVIDDLEIPTGDGIAVFADPFATSAAVGVGTEVIAFGRAFVSTRDDVSRPALGAYGVIVNPETAVYTDVLNELDEIIWEEV